MLVKQYLELKRLDLNIFFFLKWNSLTWYHELTNSNKSVSLQFFDNAKFHSHIFVHRISPTSNILPKKLYFLNFPTKYLTLSPINLSFYKQTEAILTNLIHWKTENNHMGHFYLKKFLTEQVMVGTHDLRPIW